MGFLGGSEGKESAFNAGDPCLIPRLGRFPGEGKGYPLQYSGLENSMDYIVLFTAICKASSNSQSAFLHFFSMGMVLIPSPVQCHEPPSIVYRMDK